MSFLDKAKEFVNSEEVQQGLKKAKENAEEISHNIADSDAYKKAKSDIKKVTESQDFKDGMNDLKDLGAKGLSLTSKGLDKLSKKLEDTKK